LAPTNVRSGAVLMATVITGNIAVRSSAESAELQRYRMERWRAHNKCKTHKLHL
jgi:hypothetical protein